MKLQAGYGSMNFIYRYTLRELCAILHHTGEQTLNKVPMTQV